MFDFEETFEEIIGTDDLFENDDLVVTQIILKSSMDGSLIQQTEIGIKNDAGDIVKMHTAKRRLIMTDAYSDKTFSG